MPDIQLTPDNYGNGDASFLPGDIETDSGLTTAVFVSLFTDARNPETGEGGYWGDSTEDEPLGSLLWTLKREKMRTDLPLRVKGYCESALQWLKDQSIAQAVDVTVTKTGMYSLEIQIDITKADSQTINLKYSYSWNNQFA